ncbi:phospholipase A [Sulfurimonas sp. C5]|uniref:phospholipase A n=1 Tax=Sulfurimonas sp. C5 TaxID=3036947 RepID=UPI002455234F|nr:phospholipase A [Sulfurimonas sp. C5]MDH4944201.1 phospholipase A [Sulfurimonas sp. C5]
MKYIVFLLLPIMLLAQAEEKTETWFKGSSLEAYKVNYICPLSYTDHKYKSYLNDTKYHNTEVEVQFSIKYNIVDNLLGLGGKYYLSYSQHAFWQLYTNSKPFRENIYNPEVFARYDIKNEDIPNLKTLQIGYEHQSNGNPNTTYTTVDGQRIQNISRGINTLYASFGFAHKELYADIKIWYPIFSLDDNPDIMHYIGYTGIGLKYFYNDQVFSLNARGNLATKKGSIEAAYSYPIGRSVNLYTKFFSGYAETLIDYREHLNKFSIGFSFSR